MRVGIGKKRTGRFMAVLLAVLCVMYCFPAAVMAMSPATTTIEPQRIWDYLYGKIGNPYGTAGLMANLEAESSLLPVNLQDSAESKLGFDDRSYTEAVDSGAYGKDSFIHDGAGYGLAQWLYYSRKQALYEYAKAADASIGNLDLQLAFLWEELSHDFPRVREGLANAASVREASDLVLEKYQMAGNQSETVRERLAEKGNKWLERYGSVIPPEEESADPGEEANPEGSGEEAVPEPEESALGFWDVNPGDWFYEDVRFVVEQGIMTGMTQQAFGPSVPTSRAMIVTILYRLEGSPTAGYSSFMDVERGSWYDKAVSWAQEKGIVTGYNAEFFGPADSITREQLATILYRYAAYKGYDVDTIASFSSYVDAYQISGWAADAIGWAIESGIISGMSENVLNPLGFAERVQVAVVFHRYIGRFCTA